MKLLFLYGPPAVGKFTVAKELATQAGFKLLHNHLTIDLASSVFEPGTESYFNLLRKIRFSILEAAAQASVPGLITTFVYGPARLKAVRHYVNQIDRIGEEIYFIRLYCDKSVLAERVIKEDRKKYGKLIDTEKLNKKLSELGNPFAEIKDEESLCIDTGILLPTEAAQEIKKYYKLP